VTPSWQAADIEVAAIDQLYGNFPQRLSGLVGEATGTEVRREVA